MRGAKTSCPPALTSDGHPQTVLEAPVINSGGYQLLEEL
jgi:hypothetical protein